MMCVLYIVFNQKIIFCLAFIKENILKTEMKILRKYPPLIELYIFKSSTQFSKVKMWTINIKYYEKHPWKKNLLTYLTV